MAKRNRFNFLTALGAALTGAGEGIIAQHNKTEEEKRQERLRREGYAQQESLMRLSDSLIGNRQRESDERQAKAAEQSRLDQFGFAAAMPYIQADAQRPEHEAARTAAEELRTRNEKFQLELKAIERNIPADYKFVLDEQTGLLAEIDEETEYYQQGKQILQGLAQVKARGGNPERVAAEFKTGTERFNEVMARANADPKAKALPLLERTGVKLYGQDYYERKNRGLEDPTIEYDNGKPVIKWTPRPVKLNQEQQQDEKEKDRQIKAQERYEKDLDQWEKARNEAGERSRADYKDARGVNSPATDSGLKAARAHGITDFELNNPKPQMPQVGAKPAATNTHEQRKAAMRKLRPDLSDAQIEALLKQASQ